MPGSSAAGYAIAPNYHIFQPNPLETELGKIAYGNTPMAGAAYGAMGDARQTGMADQLKYQGALNAADLQRIQASSAAAQAEQRAKTIDTLFTQGTHVDPAVAAALGFPEFNTPGQQSIVNANTNETVGKSVQAGGAGVYSAAEAGQKIDNGFLQRLAGVPVTDDTPIGVQKENAAKQPEVTLNSKQASPQGIPTWTAKGRVADLPNLLANPNLAPITDDYNTSLGVGSAAPDASRPVAATGGNAPPARGPGAGNSNATLPPRLYGVKRGADAEAAKLGGVEHSSQLMQDGSVIVTYVDPRTNRVVFKAKLGLHGGVPQGQQVK